MSYRILGHSIPLRSHNRLIRVVRIYEASLRRNANIHSERKMA